ncbi:bZIP transcription factor, partial [Metarhizium hybridum]
MSTPTSNASDSGTRTAKTSRTASNLNSAQLERKRANDRESQRAIRARTKQHIARLEHEVRRLRSRDFNREFQHLLRCNEALETELRQFRASAAVGCHRPPTCPPRGLMIPDASLTSKQEADYSSRNDTNYIPPRSVPGQHNSGQVQHGEQYQHPSLTYLNVPRSAAWAPQLATSASTGCSSVSSIGTTPASYIPVGNATEGALGPVPAPVADVGAVEFANEASHDALQLRRDKGIPLAQSGCPNQEYSDGPFPLTTNAEMSLGPAYAGSTQPPMQGSMYLAGYGS